MAVLNGIQHLTFKNGWINEDYVSKHVCRRNELQNKVEKYAPELVEKITGIPAKQLIGPRGSLEQRGLFILLVYRACISPIKRQQAPVMSTISIS
jgi:predicted molibdopterin-dependent oxidoreductase YjgC